jgi:hypothetical protein
VLTVRVGNYWATPDDEVPEIDGMTVEGETAELPMVDTLFESDMIVHGPGRNKSTAAINHKWLRQLTQLPIRVGCG